MTASERHESIRLGIRASQIIVGGLVMGAIAFLAVSLFLVYGPDPNPIQASPVPLLEICLGVSVVVIVMCLLLRSSILSQASKRFGDDEVRLFAAWRTGLIIAVAGFEASAFLCLVGGLIQQDRIGFAAGGFFVLLMAFQMPTRAGVDRWIGDQVALSTGAGASARDPRS